MWSTLESIGVQYGPTFRNISSIHQSRKELRSTSIITVPNTTVPNVLPRNHVIHPATLDAVAQAAFTALPAMAFHQASPRVFHSIERLWVSSKISREAGQAFQCRTKPDYADIKGIKAGVVLLDQDRLVVDVEGLHIRSLGGNSTQALQRALCAKVTWERDFNLSLRSDLALHTDEDEELRQLSLYFMEDALADISPSEGGELQGHYRRFYTWMKDKLQAAMPEGARPDRALLTQGLAESLRGEMLCRVGQCLAAILRGHRLAIDVMNQGGLFEKWSSSHNDAVQQESKLLHQNVHKRPHARILEIGARLDGSTRAMLEGLGSLGPVYHFSNISDDEFELAAQELARWREILLFDKLDVTTEPSSQGFDLASYDVVIASEVVQPSVQVLENIQALLKPGGKLLMVQLPHYELDRQLGLGLLAQSWDTESDGPKSSLLDAVSWEQLLKDPGFSGIDVGVSDSQSNARRLSTIISTAPQADSVQLPPSDDIVIVTSDKTGAGVFKIPRVLEDTSRNHPVSPDAGTTDAITHVPLCQADRALSLQVDVPGRLDTLVLQKMRRCPRQMRCLLK